MPSWYSVRNERSDGCGSLAVGPHNTARRYADRLVPIMRLPRGTGGRSLLFPRVPATIAQCGSHVMRTRIINVRRHMLSATTVRTLEDLAQWSHASYPDGGLLYTFTEAANQAHIMFPKQLAERRAAQLTEDDRAQLAIVICKARWVTPVAPRWTTGRWRLPMISCNP